MIMVYKLCKERLQKTSVSDIYVTNYAGDIVNLLLNKPKIYRICYFPKNDIYVIGDGYKYIHTILATAAIESGYIEEKDERNSEDILFVPASKLDKPEDYEVNGFANERNYLVPLTTGYIITYAQDTLKLDIPELYQILIRKHLIIDLPSRESDILYPQFKLSNVQLYNQLGMDCASYLRGYKKRLMMGSIKKEIEALRKLIKVIDFKKPGQMFWDIYTSEDLDNLEQELYEKEESKKKLKIEEKFQKTNIRDCFVTDYVGDIVNWLLNKPRIYRITYDVNKDLYAICDGDKHIHAQNYRSLRTLGYYSDEEPCETLNMEDFIFCPYEYADNVKNYAVYGFETERVYFTAIPTGYIITSHKNDLKDEVPDLWNMLNRRHLIIDKKRPGDSEVLYPEFHVDNRMLYNQLAMNCYTYLDGYNYSIMMGTIEEQMEAMHKLIDVIDFNQPWRYLDFKVYTHKDLDELEKSMYEKQAEYLEHGDIYHKGRRKN